MRAGLVDERRPIEARNGGRDGWRCRVEVVADGRLAHESRAMRGELAQRDRSAKRIGGVKVGKVVRHRRIEIHALVLDELHDADVGEELRNGADAVDRFGCRRHVFHRVGFAEAARPDDAIAFDERDRKRRQALVAHLGRDDTLEIGGDGSVRRVGRDRVRPLRRLRLRGYCEGRREQERQRCSRHAVMPHQTLIISTKVPTKQVPGVEEDAHADCGEHDERETYAAPGGPVAIAPRLHQRDEENEREQHEDDRQHERRFE